MSPHSGSDLQNRGSEGADRDRRTLSNRHLRVEVLPALGGKLASIVLGSALAGSGGELLQPPLRLYAPRTASMPFDQSDASGWDECLPSIGPCELMYGDRQTAKIEDHGDFWRLGFQVDESTETTLRMHAEGASLPLRFERSLRLEGPVLHLDYTLHNRGDVTVPWGWSVHPLFAVQPLDRIHLPASVKEITAQASGNGRLGAVDSKHSWPHTTNELDGAPLDLGLTGSPDDGVADKLVLPSPAEGCCAIERKTLRTLVTLHFDPKDSPWLGLWLCYGGWPANSNDSKAKKGYAVALEPCNLPVDSLADSLAGSFTPPAGSRLAPGEEKHWSLRLEISDAQER